MSQTPHKPDATALSANYALQEQRVLMRAAEARSPGEWVDIFQGIVEEGAKVMLEQNGLGHEVLPRLAPYRVAFKIVRRELTAHGLPISEDIHIEGPIIEPDSLGIPRTVDWPLGMWCKLIWAENDVLEFRGLAADVAAQFVSWFIGFHQVFIHKTTGAQLGGEQRRRLIGEGASEYLNYVQAKAADQAKDRGHPS